MSLSSSLAGGSTSKQLLSGIWGPQSVESDDPHNKTPQASASGKSNGAGTQTTHTTTMSSTDQTPTPSSVPLALDTARNNLTLERIFESASYAVDSIVQSTKRVTSPPTVQTPSPRSKNIFESFLDEACTSPCNYREFPVSPPRSSLKPVGQTEEEVDEGSLGIAPLVSPTKSMAHPITTTAATTTTRGRSELSTDSPIERRKQRHSDRLQALGSTLPVEDLTVDNEIDLTRSISELTMKSSHGEATAKLAENRRMAYYAVGKHHKNSGRGGNRRCYFTGKLILGGAPFYAGSVQQGLRTLVVFCLPSAIGLPKEGVDHLFSKQRSDMTSGKESTASSSQGVVPMPRTMADLKGLHTASIASLSRATSADDMSFLEEELDPNWDVDRDYLLQVLPEPNKDLLDEMAVRYPEQFETLPIQVRSPHCWRLFIKFCFFSGLPIAEGEMHYKVIDEIANDVYGEEIILSHEVMEAVNGESAEILRLPNLKTFRYLRKHYTQQSGKLSETVFQRSSWEMMRPEI